MCSNIKIRFRMFAAVLKLGKIVKIYGGFLTKICARNADTVTQVRKVDILRND